MLTKRKKQGGFLPDSDWAHYLRFAVVPLVAIILIIVILAMDSDQDQEETETFSIEETVLAGEEEASEAPAGTDAEGANGTEDGDLSGTEPDETRESGGEAEPSGETETPGETEPVSYADIDISQYTLKEDEVPEMVALVHTYCQAREDLDVELLARLYGITGMTEEEIAQEKERLELVHASVRSYENIACYSIEGPEPDSYVIFPYFELNYREAEVYMPQLTWGYATKNDDGSYIMTQEVSPPVADYIARIGERDDVKALIAQVEEAQAEAVAADEKLSSIYGNTGSEVVLTEAGN